MNINSPDAFIEAIGGPEPDKTGNSLPGHELDGAKWDDPVSWGPASSLEGQDAMGRMGDSVPMAGDKLASFFRDPDAYPMQKEALLGGALRFGGKMLFGGGKSLGKGFMTGLRGLGQAGEASRGFFHNRAMGKAMQETGSEAAAKGLLRKRNVAAGGTLALDSGLMAGAHFGR